MGDSIKFDRTLVHYLREFDDIWPRLVRKAQKIEYVETFSHGNDHHINELNDGGSDTPDTVIVLRPNCHFRVHHGEDGEEYNQKLKQKLEEIEQGS